MTDIGYLQHGMGTPGPFRTEEVRVKNSYGSKWVALFEGRWRVVHIQERGLYIVYLGERIAIQIDGV